jgi:hypothetical protein
LSREEEGISILGHQETTAHRFKSLNEQKHPYSGVDTPFEELAGLVSPLLVETATLVILLGSESSFHPFLLLMNR